MATKMTKWNDGPERTKYLHLTTGELVPYVNINGPENIAYIIPLSLPNVSVLISYGMESW